MNTNTTTHLYTANGQHVRLKARVKNVPIVSAARGTFDVVSAALAKSNATLFSTGTAVKTSFVSKSSTTVAQVVPKVETPAPPTQIINIDQSSPSSCSWCLPAFVIIGGALVACVVIMGAVKK